MPRPDETKSPSRLVQIAASIVIIWALRFAQEVLVPIALAVLFAFLLAPLAHRLERKKLPRVAAVLVVVLLAFSVIGGIGFIVARQVNDFTQHLPEYTKQVSAGLDRLKGSSGVISRLESAGKAIMHDASTSKPSSQPVTANAAPGNSAGEVGQVQPDGGDEHVQKVEMVSPTPPALEMLSSAFGPVLSVLATAFIVIVLCIFMLLSREDLRDRVLRLVSNGHLNVTTQAMDDAAKRISRYLLMQACTNGIYGVLVAIGLSMLKVPNPMLWGLIASLLRFIPYVGPWLGASGPVLLAFVTHGAHRGFIAIGMYAGLELSVSSFVEPWLYGTNTGVSSVAILVAAVFWAWLWGGVGLLLATPLTVLLVVIGKYVPQLEYLSILLGDEEVFDPPTRYYQRLLASDPEEANDLIDQYLKKMSLDQVYETVMIPALGFAHRDRFRGRLDGERADLIRGTMKDEIYELSERAAEPVADPSKPGSEQIAPKTYVEATQRISGRGENAALAEIAWAPIQRTTISGADAVQVVCLPARDEADELAGMMFAQVLTRNGLKAEAVSASALASEMVEIVGKLKADIVVVSALPPSAISHARYLCKRLHQAYPQVVIVVGLWTSRVDLTEAKKKITCTTRDLATTTFSDGFHQLEQLIHPMALAKETSAKTLSEKDLAVAKKTAEKSGQAAGPIN